MRSAALVLVLPILGSVSASAHAQSATQAAPAVQSRVVPPSKKVWKYAVALAKALQLVPVTPVSRRYPRQVLKDAPLYGLKKTELQAKEIDVRFKEFRVRRILCRTSEQAQAWFGLERIALGLRGVARATDATRRIVSVRGRQVLVLEGKRLTKQTFLRLAFHHGWTALPCKVKTLDMISIDAGEASVTRSWRNKALQVFANRTLDRLRRRPAPKPRDPTVITWHTLRSAQIDQRAEDRQSDVFVDPRAGVRVATGPTDALKATDLLVRVLFLDHTRRLHPTQQPHPLTPAQPVVNARASIGASHRDD